MKIYHIYTKGRCIYHNLSEKEFSETWEMLHKMVELLKVSTKKGDLSYEEVITNT